MLTNLQAIQSQPPNIRLPCLSISLSSSFSHVGLPSYCSEAYDSCLQNQYAQAPDDQGTYGVIFRKMFEASVTTQKITVQEIAEQPLRYQSNQQQTVWSDSKLGRMLIHVLLGKVSKGEIRRILGTSEGQFFSKIQKIKNSLRVSARDFLQMLEYSRGASQREPKKWILKALKFVETMSIVYKELHSAEMLHSLKPADILCVETFIPILSSLNMNIQKHTIVSKLLPHGIVDLNLLSDLHSKAQKMLDRIENPGTQKKNKTGLSEDAMHSDVIEYGGEDSYPMTPLHTRTIVTSKDNIKNRPIQSQPRLNWQNQGNLELTSTSSQLDEHCNRGPAVMSAFKPVTRSRVNAKAST